MPRGCNRGTVPGTALSGCSIPARRAPGARRSSGTTRSCPRPGPAAAPLPASPPRSRGAERSGAGRPGPGSGAGGGQAVSGGAVRSAEGSAVSRSAGEPWPRPLWRSIKVRRRRACPCPCLCLLLLLGSGVGGERSRVGDSDRYAREWRTAVGMENHEWGRAVRAASRTLFAVRKLCRGLSAAACPLPPCAAMLGRSTGKGCGRLSESSPPWEPPESPALGCARPFRPLLFVLTFPGRAEPALGPAV